ERALVAVVQEAYVHGVSTRKVDELMRALGLRGSRSPRSRACAGPWTPRSRRSGHGQSAASTYVWIDATYHKVRRDGRMVSMATVVAIGVTADGERQVLGVDAGPSEGAAFWTAFLRDLKRRGLQGVRLVISDAHEGIKKAVAT